MVNDNATPKSYPALARQFAEDNFEEISSHARHEASARTEIDFYVFEDGMYSTDKETTRGYGGEVALRAPLRRYSNPESLVKAFVRVGVPRMPEDLIVGDRCWVRGEAPLSSRTSSGYTEASRWQLRFVARLGKDRAFLTPSITGGKTTDEALYDGPAPFTSPNARRGRNIVYTQAQLELRIWANENRAAIAQLILDCSDDDIVAKAALAVGYSPVPPRTRA